MKTLLTLVILHREGSVLLGKKKRGFGKGLWNGFGGKVEDGESILEAAHREVSEECCVQCGELEQRAIVRFTFEGEPAELEVHVFYGSDFDGDPTETEEMQPKWFRDDQMPFDEMWQDDRHWIPTFLQGKYQVGSFHFAGMNEDAPLLSWQVKEVDSSAFSC